MQLAEFIIASRMKCYSASSVAFFTGLRKFARLIGAKHVNGLVRQACCYHFLSAFKTPQSPFQFSLITPASCMIPSSFPVSASLKAGGAPELLSALLEGENT